MDLPDIIGVAIPMTSSYSENNLDFVLTRSMMQAAIGKELTIGPGLIISSMKRAHLAYFSMETSMMVPG